MADSPTKLLSFNSELAPCAVCGADGMPCARCRLDYYCGKDHQKMDWGRHKAGCGAVELRQDAVLGRHLVATKDIPAGTVVLRETALVVFPKFDRGYVYCVGCCLQLLSDSAWSSCRLCGWPVCGTPCSKRQEHRAECDAFQRAKFRISRGAIESDGKLVWNALAALRVHLAGKEKARILDLQSDFLDNQPKPDETMVDFIKNARERWREVARWLRDVVGLQWEPEQDLVDAAGRLHINGVGSFCNSGPLQAHEDPKEHEAGALFSALSMMEHSCMPTTRCVETAVFPFSKDPEVKTHCHERIASTTSLVRQGEHLTVDYLGDDPFADKHRRYVALSRWGMECSCERCWDPSECGLYLGSTCCAKCSRPDKLHYVVETAPFSTVWMCQSCGVVIGDRHTLRENNTLRAVLEYHGYSRRELTNYIEHSMWPRGPLHPTHSLILLAKRGMTKQQIDHEKSSDDRKELACWEADCRDLLNALDTLGRKQCTVRFNVLGTLTSILKSKLAVDQVLSTKRRPNPNASRETRVQEIEQLLEEAAQMVPPGGRKAFRTGQEKYLAAMRLMISSGITHGEMTKLS